MYVFSKQLEILCPDREHLFLQNLCNNVFSLKVGSFEYLRCITLIPKALFCSIVCTSSTVRLSISIDKLFIYKEKVKFFKKVFFMSVNICSSDNFLMYFFI